MAADVDGELTAREAAVLDALYGDEAGALDDEQRTTLDDWQAVRGVVRHAREHGFDHEPPAAGTRGSMEVLLAAARAHAPAEKRPGWWARLAGWMTPLVAHPALAGASALVVVGGAAGLLYVKGKHRVAEPPAAARAPAPAPTDEPTAPGRAVDLRAATDDGEAPAAEAASGAGEPETAGPAGGALSRPRPRPMRTPPKETERADGLEWSSGTGTGTATGTVGGSAGGEARRASQEPAADEPSPEPMAPPPPATTVPPPAAPPAPPAPPPSPRPVEADRATTTLSGSRTPPAPRAPVSIAEDDATPATAARRAEAVRLTSQARAAARAGACATVTTRSRQVQALDAAYHREVFVRDPDIARCL